jgi:hypothetical protein
MQAKAKIRKSLLVELYLDFMAYLTLALLFGQCGIDVLAKVK